MVKFSLPAAAAVNVCVLLLFFLFHPPTLALSQEWEYTIQPGDNLWNLSKKHLVSVRYWEQLLELNGIKDPRNIPPGSTIRIPLAWLKAGSSIGRVVELVGEATIVSHLGGEVLPAGKGMFLWENDTLRTGAGSNATLEFADGSKLLVQENSELKMENLMRYGETGMAETQIRLQSGRVHNKVTPAAGPGSRFEISTPSAIAAVRGTEYRLSAEETEESRAEVVRGEIGVDSAGTSRIIPQGFGTITFMDRKPLEPVKLLDPPDLTELPSTITTVPFPLQLKPVAGAARYRLQIAENEEFDALLFDATFPSANLWGPDLPDGMYYLRVHAIDSLKLEGLDSVHPFTLDAHPVPPMPIKPADDEVLGEAKPVFQWSEPENVSEYGFQLARDDRFNRILLDEQRYGKTMFTPDREIEPGLYYWRVASIDRDGNKGPFGDHQRFRRTPPSPDMSDAAMDTKEMVFRWRKGEPGQKYRCQISRDPDFTSLVADSLLAEPRYSLKDFDSGSYYVRVAIVDTDGFAGPFSPYQKIRVPFPPPSPWSLLVPLGYGLMILL